MCDFYVCNSIGPKQDGCSLSASYAFFYWNFVKLCKTGIYGSLSPQRQKKCRNKKYKVSKNAIAVAWILRHPAHMQVLLGTMTPAHIIDSAKGSDITLTSQEWYDLYLAAGNDLP